MSSKDHVIKALQEIIDSKNPYHYPYEGFDEIFIANDPDMSGLSQVVDLKAIKLAFGKSNEISDKISTIKSMTTKPPFNFYYFNRFYKENLVKIRKPDFNPREDSYEKSDVFIELYEKILNSFYVGSIWAGKLLDETFYNKNIKSKAGVNLLEQQTALIGMKMRQDTTIKYGNLKHLLNYLDTVKYEDIKKYNKIKDEVLEEFNNADKEEDEVSKRGNDEEGEINREQEEQGEDEEPSSSIDFIDPPILNPSSVSSLMIAGGGGGDDDKPPRKNNDKDFFGFRKMFNRSGFRFPGSAEKQDGIIQKIKDRTGLQKNGNDGTSYFIDFESKTISKLGRGNPIRFYVDYDKVSKDVMANVYTHFNRVTGGNYDYLDLDEGDNGTSYKTNTNTGIIFNENFKKMLNIKPTKIDSFESLKNKLEEELNRLTNVTNPPNWAKHGKDIAKLTETIADLNRERSMIDGILKKTSKITENPFVDVAYGESGYVYSKIIDVDFIKGALVKNSILSPAALDVITSSMNESFSDTLNLAVAFANGASLSDSPTDMQRSLYNAVIGKYLGRVANKEREVISESHLKERLISEPPSSFESLGSDITKISNNPSVVARVAEVQERLSGKKGADPYSVSKPVYGYDAGMKITQEQLKDAQDKEAKAREFEPGFIRRGEDLVRAEAEKKELERKLNYASARALELDSTFKIPDPVLSLQSY